MKKLLLIILMIGFVSGCAAPPITMVDDFRGKKITRCDNDTFFFRETYSVAWDHPCKIECYCNDCLFHSSCYDSAGYPVSYRSKEYNYEEYCDGYAVTLPGGGNIAVPINRVEEAD